MSPLLPPIDPLLPAPTPLLLLIMDFPVKHYHRCEACCPASRGSSWRAVPAPPLTEQESVQHTSAMSWESSSQLQWEPPLHSPAFEGRGGWGWMPQSLICCSCLGCWFVCVFMSLHRLVFWRMRISGGTFRPQLLIVAAIIVKTIPSTYNPLLTPEETHV